MTDKEIIKLLIQTVSRCRSRFAFYVSEHKQKDKLAKAAANQHFVDICDHALERVKEGMENG